MERGGVRRAGVQWLLEGRYSPLAYMQIVATGLAVMAIVLPVFMFSAASYRPERDPQITQALNDLGWLPFVMNWPAATIQSLAIGCAIFGYRGARPVFPRWLGYFNFWCAFIFAAGGLVVLFKTGVFAWGTVCWRSGWSQSCSARTSW